MEKRQARSPGDGVQSPGICKADEAEKPKEFTASDGREGIRRVSPARRRATAQGACQAEGRRYVLLVRVKQPGLGVVRFKRVV